MSDATESPFVPEQWATVEGFSDLTDLTYHRTPGRSGERDRADRLRPSRGAQRLPSAHRRRAVPHPRPRPSHTGCRDRAAHRERPEPARRRLGVLQWWRPAHPRAVGYQYAGGETADSVDSARVAAEGGRLHILEVQRLIRTMPKVVIAVVGGWAAGGGHSLHVVCDLTIASRQHARFKQTDADVGSFDAGYGSAYLAKQVGQKFAREIFFLGRSYDAETMQRMGAVNEVADHAELENTAVEWARAINAKSPTAQRMLKFAFNLTDDGLMGQQVFAGEATRLAYMTDEAVEGRDAFLEKRDPDWTAFPYYY